MKKSYASGMKSRIVLISVAYLAIALLWAGWCPQVRAEIIDPEVQIGYLNRRLVDIEDRLYSIEQRKLVLVEQAEEAVSSLPQVALVLYHQAELMEAEIKGLETKYQSLKTEIEAMKRISKDYPKKSFKIRP